MPVGESILFHVARIRVRTFLGQIQLTVHIEVVNLLQRHALLSSLFFLRLVVLGAPLAVSTFLLDDELLARVGVNLVHLGELLLLLLLELGLLLLVLF